MRDRRRHHTLRPLTRREQELASLLAMAQCDKEIASALGISLHTERFHIAHLFEKLGVTSRAQAIVKLLEGEKGPRMSDAP